MRLQKNTQLALYSVLEFAARPGALVPAAEVADKYGESAETSRTDLLNAISETEKSLVTIHDWDRSRGLRKCHSRTVVKTRRSRAKVKAFLLGVDPPKELVKKSTATKRKAENDP